MKLICSQCKRYSEDGNLWCPEVDCPGGEVPHLMEYGDYLGNLRVLRVVRAFSMATIYEVEREQKSYLLKVATPGYHDYLIKEAETLQTLTDTKTRNPTLPILCEHGTPNEEDPFGKIVFRGEMKYFILLEHKTGDFLRDWLLDNPEPWHRHAGWFIMTLAQAIDDLQQETGQLHLNLNPDSILVYYNKAKVPLPFLLDLGLGVYKQTQMIQSDLQKAQNKLSSAYVAPEITMHSPPTESTDVYNLGILLYEMLAGKPAYEYRLRKSQDILNDIKDPRIKIKLTRQDLPVAPSLLTIVNTSISRNSGERYPHVSDIRDALEEIYGPVKDKSFFANLKAVVGIIVLLSVLLASVILMLVLSIT